VEDHVLRRSTVPDARPTLSLTLNVSLAEDGRGVPSEMVRTRASSGYASARIAAGRASKLAYCPAAAASIAICWKIARAALYRAWA
jgi:hypothetical protein